MLRYSQAYNESYKVKRKFSNITAKSALESKVIKSMDIMKKLEGNVG